MGKRIEYNNPVTTQIHDDLETYLEFCRDFGYRFDECDLYSNKSVGWRQFQKFVAGKPVRDQWEEDLKRLV